MTTVNPHRNPVSNIISKEYKFSKVYEFLGKIMGKRVVPTVCKDNDFQMIVDQYWRAYMDDDVLDELYDRLHDRNMFMEYFDEQVRNDNYEFLAVSTRR